MKYVSQDRHLDQDHVDDLARRAAAGFADLGISSGDAVGLLMVNEIEVVVCNQALSLLGAAPVPINWHSTADEVGYIAVDASLKALVAHDVLIDVAEEGLALDVPLIVVTLPSATANAVHMTKPGRPSVRAHREWDEWLADQRPWTGQPLPARPAIIYTSGTTGKPKGVVRARHGSEEARAAQGRFLNQVWGVEPGLRMLLMAPLYHSAPAAYTRAAISAGGPDGELHFMAKFRAEDTLRTIEEARITHMWMVPTMFVLMLQLPEEVRRRYDVSSVRNVVHSGAPCPVDIKLRMIDWFGPVINEFYGSTEVGPVTYATAEDYQRHPGTVGRVLDGCTVAVLGTDGRPAPVGTTGEIAALNSSYSSFTYRNRQADRDELNAGGLIRTGDIGVFEPDGVLFLKDRKKDMVISGGVNLYPAEVEDVLLQLSNVRDGAAFGLPDEIYGERLVAAVELQTAEPDVEERLLRELRERLASTKVPRHIYIVEDLPRSETGKIAKHRLRDLLG